MKEILIKLFFKEKVFFYVLFLWAVFALPGLPTDSEQSLKTEIKKSAPTKPPGKRRVAKGFEKFRKIIYGEAPAEKLKKQTSEFKKIELADVKAMLAEYPKKHENKPLFFRQVEFQGLGLVNLASPSATSVRVSYGFLGLQPDFQNLKNTYKLGKLIPSSID